MFTGARKMTSGSSSSSENTPLLNGSHEGPCYAYSYANREDDEEEDEDKTDQSSADADAKKNKLLSILGELKTFLLVLLIIFCAVCLSFMKINDPDWSSVVVTQGKTAYINLTHNESTDKELIHLRVKGPFVTGEFGSSTLITFALSRITFNQTYQKVSQTWIVLVGPDSSDNQENEIELEHDFPLSDHGAFSGNTYQLAISTNEKENYRTLFVELTASHKLSVVKFILAISVLVGFHIVIILELLPRSLASMTAAAVAISCLALNSESPSLKEVVSWMDIEVLSLVFGMSLLTSILCETGFFEFVAILAYKIAGGHTWSLFTVLCFVTAILSIGLDSITTVILMSAFTVRLCEAMNTDPKHLMMVLVIFSNIGGTIGYSTFSLKSSMIIGYSSYILHVFPAVLLSLVIGYILWWLRYRDISKLRFNEPLEVIELKHEREVWRKAYHFLYNYSREEESVKAILKRKISALETVLMKKLYDSKISTDDYRTSLKELTHTLKVKKRFLLFKSCVVISIVLILLLLRNVPQFNLSSGWITVLGALCLLILGDFEKSESVLNRVEWSNLLFLASIFVLMKALVKLDLVEYLMSGTINFINEVNDNNRLLVSIIIFVWISSLSSTLIIPFPVVMLEVIKNGDEHLNPLVFALSLGACLGGNGSLLGSSANIVSAGLTEQHGYRFSYLDFFKVGFPIMIVTTATSMIYLLICHVWLDWNE